MAQVQESFARALGEERLRNARQIAAFRLLGTSTFLAINAFFLVTYPGWVGPVGPLVVYTAVAAVLFLASRRSDAAARFSSLGIALIDMPLLLFLFLDATRVLEAAGHRQDATAVSHQAAAYYLLLLALAALALRERQLYLATAVAALCSVAVIGYATDPDATRMTMILAAVVAMGFINRYASARAVRLVGSVSEEQLRRQRLGRYFSPRIAERIEQGSTALVAGEHREVTILFCDIRDFTKLSEEMRGEEVVSLLNDFHTRMAGCIFEHGGTLDKLLGDGLMAYFGAPVDQPDHATRGVRCALAMQAACGRLNEERKTSGQPPLGVGIGIHTGTVVLGDIGSPEHRDYTVVGDAVNVASRIEQLTKDRGVPILVSENTRRLVGPEIAFSHVGDMAVRGKAAPVACFLPQARLP